MARGSGRADGKHHLNESRQVFGARRTTRPCARRRTGLIRTTLQATGKTIIPVREESAGVLKYERDPDMEASTVLLARLDAGLAKDLIEAKVATRAGVQEW